MSRGSALHMETANPATTFYKGHDSVLVRKATTLWHILFLTYEGLIYLDNASGAAHRGQIARTHSLANTMAQAIVADDRRAQGHAFVANEHAGFWTGDQFENFALVLCTKEQ